jgi:hypothetical protein
MSPLGIRNACIVSYGPGRSVTIVAVVCLRAQVRSADSDAAPSSFATSPEVRRVDRSKWADSSEGATRWCGFKAGPVVGFR